MSISENCSDPQMEGIKKQRVFKDIGLDLIIDCNMKIVHYLDVTFNLSDGTCRLYQKPLAKNPDTIIQFTHLEFNHSPKHY